MNKADPPPAAATPAPFRLPVRIYVILPYGLKLYYLTRLHDVREYGNYGKVLPVHRLEARFVPFRPGDLEKLMRKDFVLRTCKKTMALLRATGQVKRFMVF